MDSQDSSRKVPLSVQIAMAMIGNDDDILKIKADMIREGFQTVWGVRKASEWILQLKSAKDVTRDILCLHGLNDHREF